MTTSTRIEPRHVDAAGVPVLDHLSFLCRTLLAGDATGEAPSASWRSAAASGA